MLNKHLFVYGGESVFRVDDATAAGRTSEKSSKVEGRELYNDSFLLNTETAEWARVTPDNINAASKRCGHTAVLQVKPGRVCVSGGNVLTSPSPPARCNAMALHGLWCLEASGQTQTTLQWWAAMMWFATTSRTLGGMPKKQLEWYGVLPVWRALWHVHLPLAHRVLLLQPPPGRDSHVAVLIDNRMWVHGGKDENSLLEDLFCLNVDT